MKPEVIRIGNKFVNMGLFLECEWIEEGVSTDKYVPAKYRVEEENVHNFTGPYVPSVPGVAIWFGGAGQEEETRNYWGYEAVVKVLDYLENQVGRGDRQAIQERRSQWST